MAVIRSRMFRAVSRVSRCAVALPARPLRSFVTSMPRAIDVDADDDFKTRAKVPDSDDGLQQRLAEIVSTHPVVLFMKGTPQQPMCGFSMRVVQQLNAVGVPYHAINVLDNEAVRQGVKVFSDWPTIPQLYIAGDFVGGADIVGQLFEDGELAKMLHDADEAKDATA